MYVLSKIQLDWQYPVQATCSLNYLPFLGTVKGWCSPTLHPPPTKHNILCNGKSASEIIEVHSDFNATLRRQVAKLGETTFNIVRQPPPQYVILLETSSAMARVWKWVRKGLQSLIRSVG